MYRVLERAEVGGSEDHWYDYQRYNIET